jgi:molecular chaperone GrpE
VEENEVASDNGRHDELGEQLVEAQREAAENHDKYLRALAESENMRRRLDRLCEDRLWQEKKRLLTHIVELGDQLEKALDYADVNDPVGAGVDLVYQQLQQILAQEGVQALESVGQAFDPKVHEAVEITNGSGEHARIRDEFRRGYMLGSRLLRPARVQVEKTD